MRCLFYFYTVAWRTSQGFLADIILKFHEDVFRLSLQTSTEETCHRVV